MLVDTRTPGQSFVYDDFSISALSGDRWRYLQIPQRDGAPWACFEPNATTRVGEGTLDIHVPRFAPKHNTVQVFDNLKHQLASTETFSTVAEPMTFALDMAATSIGMTPTDYRDGFASFMLLDEQTGWSYSVCSNGKHTFGLYDSLRKTYHARKPPHVFEAPAPSVNFLGNSRHHDIVLDRAGQRLEWWVDGQIACRISDAEIPSDVLICLGLATLSAIETTPAEIYSAAAGLSVSFGPVSVGTASPQPPGVAEVDG
jgi:Family of unknown function (DUF6081)